MTTAVRRPLGRRRDAAERVELTAGPRPADEHEHADADRDEDRSTGLGRRRAVALDDALQRERPDQRRGDHGLHEDHAALRQRPRLHEQGEHGGAAAGEPARVPQQPQQQTDRPDAPVRDGGGGVPLRVVRHGEEDRRHQPPDDRQGDGRRVGTVHHPQDAGRPAHAPGHLPWRSRVAGSALLG
jgi:hypothetical protein